MEIDLSKRFKVGDLVRFAVAKPSSDYPYTVNTAMATLYGEILEVVDEFEDSVKHTQKIFFKPCEHTEDIRNVEHQMHWSFSSPMFELVEELQNRVSLKMSFDDLLEGR